MGKASKFLMKSGKSGSENDPEFESKQDESTYLSLKSKQGLIDLVEIIYIVFLAVVISVPIFMVVVVIVDAIAFPGLYGEVLNMVGID